MNAHGRSGSHRPPTHPRRTGATDVGRPNFQLFALARRRWPDDPDLADARFRYEARAGDPDQAARMMADPRAPFFMPPARRRFWLALLDARKGRDVEGAVRLFESDAAASNDPSILFADADALADMRRGDLALNALARIGSRPVPASILMFRDYWAPARADPRFIAFAARQGLASIWQKTGKWPDFCREPSLRYDCKTVARDLSRQDARAASTG